MATDGLPEIAEQLVKQVTPYAYLGNPQFIDTKALLVRALRLAIEADATVFGWQGLDEVGRRNFIRERIALVVPRMVELLKAGGREVSTKSRGGWQDWIESEEGKRSTDISTLPPGSQGATYLENRLWAAFVAGAKFEREKAKAVVNGGMK